VQVGNYGTQVFSKVFHLKYSPLMGEAEGKKQFAISKHRQDDAKMGFKQMGKDTDWINLAQDTDSVLAVLNMVTNHVP
jgi:hypothetical protein